jgi:hypothetical protein
MDQTVPSVATARAVPYLLRRKMSLSCMPLLSAIQQAEEKHQSDCSPALFNQRHRSPAHLSYIQYVQCPSLPNSARMPKQLLIQACLTSKHRLINQRIPGCLNYVRRLASTRCLSALASIAGLTARRVLVWKRSTSTAAESHSVRPDAPLCIYLTVLVPEFDSRLRRQH